MNRFLYLITLILIINHAEAQDSLRVTLTGRVLDHRQEPILGANIIVKGTIQGTIVNNMGYYQLEYIGPNEDITLQISFVGYKAKEVKINPAKVTPQIEDVYLEAGGMFTRGPVGMPGDRPLHRFWNRTTSIFRK